MNLSAYDVVDQFTLKKPYVNVANRRLYINDIVNQKYYLWLKRFDKEYNDYQYFVLLTNNPKAVEGLNPCNYSTSNQVRVPISEDIFHTLANNRKTNFNVVVSKVEEQEDCTIYSVTV